MSEDDGKENHHSMRRKASANGEVVAGSVHNYLATKGVKSSQEKERLNKLKE